MKYLFVYVLFHLCFIASAKDITATIYLIDSSNVIVSTEQIVVNDNKPNPILKLFKKKQRLNKRITAAVLAFPFPFGIVGLHRIYLGTKPHVPVVYIGSLGGIFGLLPLIDFIAITTTKDFEHYRDNGDVFMWIKD